MSFEPLKGLRVLDLTSVVVGPVCTWRLGQYGAEIVKIESPEGDLMRGLGGLSPTGQHSGTYLHLNRGKRNVCLDLKKAGAKEAMTRLVASSDIIVANMRPQALERLGLDSASIRSRHPDKIYCLITGYGTDGPYTGQPTYDSVVQGAAGVAGLTLARDGEPTYVPMLICDHVSGEIAAGAILAAVLERKVSGKGCSIEVPMFETMAAFVLQEHLAQHSFDPPVGAPGDLRLLSRHNKPVKTSDGWISLTVNTDQQVRAFLKATDRPHLLADPRFSSVAARAQNVAAWFEIRSAPLVSRTTAGWLDVLRAADIAAQPINTLESLQRDPHLQAVGLIGFEEHPTEGRTAVIRSTIRFDDEYSSMRMPSQPRGWETREVLAEIGYASNDIDELLSAGAAISSEMVSQIHKVGDAQKGAINAVASLALEGDIGILTLNSPPVNALSQQVRDGVQKGIEQAIDHPAIKAIVLICDGRTFIAGADIAEFGKSPQTPSVVDIEDTIENSPKPVVAAIHGTALGGGLETALCCHYRVAVPSAKCGLPEVKLGLLPGAGGTQRLPRVVGPEAALDMVTSGRHVDAKTSHAAGLFDELVTEGELRKGAIDFAKRVVVERRPLRKVRDLNDKMIAARAKPEIFADFRKANARKFRGFLAPEYNIRAIEAAVNKPFDEGLEIERTMFTELLNGTQSAAQRYVFFAERQVWKIPDVPDDTPTVAIKKIGIVGAGTMGGGIAMNFANAGIPVTIVEMKADALERGLGVVRKNYERSTKSGKLTMADVDKRMQLLTGSLELEQLADCDLVIEAIFENMDVKKDVFGKLDRIVKQGAILASNTSALDIDEISTAVKRPEWVIGLHFFSPANVMRLLEVVRTAKSSNTVIATSMQLAKKIGKIAALVGVCPGFVGNRILYARTLQANAMLMEGAMPWDIDKVMYDFGLPMGPYAMSDLAGLDLGWIKEKSSSSTIREVLCEKDRRGQKTGAGFYDYDEQRNAKPSPVTEQIIKDFAAKSGNVQCKISEQEILERCVYAMINEGAKILEEKIAIRPSDIDIVWINGYGWPVYRGGPMFYGDTVGLSNVVAKLKEFGPRLGASFTISPLLERLAAEGKRFQDLK